MADTYNITRHNQSLSSVFPQATVTTLHYNGRNIHGTMIFISIFFFFYFLVKENPLMNLVVYPVGWTLE